MEGYIHNDELNICATNFDDFEKLLNKAENEAQQLLKTIHELRGYNIKLNFDFKSISSE